MKIENHSDNIQTREIRALFNFVKQYTKYSYCAVLRVCDAPPAKMTGGFANHTEPDPDLYDPVAPSSVELLVGDRSPRFPYKDQHVPELPPVTINTWEEEVLLVLAHELRHIDQFWSWDQINDGHLIEVDAERFAIEVLEKWRKTAAVKLAA